MRYGAMTFPECYSQSKKKDKVFKTLVLTRRTQFVGTGRIIMYFNTIYHVRDLARMLKSKAY
jgi:hypothetical protein